MIFKLSSLCLLLCYLMFPAFLVLRYTRPDQPRPYRLPGRRCGRLDGHGRLLALRVPDQPALLQARARRAPIPPRRRLLLGGETLLTIVVGLLLVPRGLPLLKAGEMPN